MSERRFSTQPGPHRGLPRAQFLCLPPSSCLQLVPSLPHIIWERATSDIPRSGRGRETSFSLWTAGWGPRAGLASHGCEPEPVLSTRPALGWSPLAPAPPAYVGQGATLGRSTFFSPEQRQCQPQRRMSLTRRLPVTQLGQPKAASEQGGSRGANGGFSSLNATGCHQSGTFSSPGLKMGVMGNLSALRSALAHTLGSSPWAPKPARALTGASPLACQAGTEGKAGLCLQFGAPSCCDGGERRYP